MINFGLKEWKLVRVAHIDEPLAKGIRIIALSSLQLEALFHASCFDLRIHGMIHAAWQAQERSECHSVEFLASAIVTIRTNEQIQLPVLTISITWIHTFCRKSRSKKSLSHETFSTATVAVRYTLPPSGAKRLK